MTQTEKSSGEFFRKAEQAGMDIVPISEHNHFAARAGEEVWQSTQSQEMRVKEDERTGKLGAQYVYDLTSLGFDYILNQKYSDAARTEGSAANIADQLVAKGDKSLEYVAESAHLDAARNYDRTGNFPAALRHYKQYMEAQAKHPDDLISNLHLHDVDMARCQNATGNFKDSAETLQKYKEHEEKSGMDVTQYPDYRRELGISEMGTGMLDAGTKDIEEATKLQKQQSDAYNQLRSSGYMNLFYGHHRPAYGSEYGSYGTGYAGYGGYHSSYGSGYGGYGNGLGGHYERYGGPRLYQRLPEQTDKTSAK